MANPIKKGRFGGEDLKEFIRLQARLKLHGTHGADSKTLQEAVNLANKYLDLQEILRALNKDQLGGII